MEELEEVWKEFFSRKVFFRELMLSKVAAERKINYVMFVNSFEIAFHTKRFVMLTKIVKDRKVAKARNI